jgi:hypothetical protein
MLKLSCVDGYNLYSYHNITKRDAYLNPLNAKLNPICPLQVLLGAHHILHVRR